MLTYVSEAGVVLDERAAYRPFRATVERITPLGPSFLRITFSGGQFEWFAEHALDQRVKIVFPLADGRLSDLGVDDENAVLSGSWHASWRALPDTERNPFRTYTVRAIRPADREIDIDFVVHGDGGPAARWVQGTAVGDQVLIVGPDARSIHSAIGIDWHPGDATELLLAGDETAAPAICGILEKLPAGARAQAFIEVPTASDARAIDSAADVTVTWLGRDVGEELLENAVRRWTADNPVAFAESIAREQQIVEEIDVDTQLLWESPDDASGPFYAWLAGESAVIKTLRRHLVSELGIDRKRVAFMGYWRLGKSEAQG